MQACVLHSVGDLRCESRPTPQLKPGQALIRVGATGVCGSDLPRVFEKGTYRFPLIPGHEMSGTVEEVLGPGEKGIKPGIRVAVYPLIPCRKCEYCDQALFHLCDRYDYLGSRSDGGFAEYVVAPIENLVPVPDGVETDMAAMTEPAAVALHALRQGKLAAGDTVWIVGAGPIGLMLSRWAKSLGAARVLISDIDEKKLALASAWGVETANAARLDAVEWILATTGGRGADVVVEAVGIPTTVRQALRGARKRGRVVLMGNPSGDLGLPQREYWEILRRELRLCGTWNSDKQEWTEVLEAMANGKLDLRELVTHRISLEETPQLLKRMYDRAEWYIKVLVKP